MYKIIRNDPLSVKKIVRSLLRSGHRRRPPYAISGTQWSATSEGYQHIKCFTENTSSDHAFLNFVSLNIDSSYSMVLFFQYGNSLEERKLNFMK